MTQYPVFHKLYSYANFGCWYTIFEDWVFSRTRLLSMETQSL